MSIKLSGSERIISVVAQTGRYLTLLWYRPAAMRSSPPSRIRIPAAAWLSLSALVALPGCGDNSAGPDIPDASPRPDAPAPETDAAPPAAIEPTYLGAGNHFSVFRDPATQRVVTAGENIRAQLGLGLIDPDLVPDHEYPVPQLVAGLEGLEIQAVYAGQLHAAAIDADGDLYIWGLNNVGAAGLGAAIDDPTVADPGCAVVPTGSFYDDKPDHHICTATRQPALTGVVKVAPGNGFTLAIDNLGRLYSWGNNASGQLGHGDEERRYVPQQVQALADEVIVDIAVGIGHVVAVSNSGAVYAWGRNRDGEVGQGNTDDNEILTPTRVAALDGAFVVSVGAGNYHSFAITDSGALWGWGENDFGQLGIGTIDTTEATPVEITLPAGVSARSATGGSRHTYMLSVDGDVYAWGRVGEGQLGNGEVEGADPSYVLSPAPIAAFDAPEVVELTAGPSHGLARTADGIIYGWGSNGQGRLAQGTRFNFQTLYSVPVPLDLSRAVVKEPVHSAVGIAFTDSDLDAGEIAGDIVVTRAANEDDIDRYVVYWGSGVGDKLAGAPAIARVARTGADVTVAVAADTAIPAGATHVLVYTENRFGEMSFGVSGPLVDLVP